MSRQIPHGLIECKMEINGIEDWDVHQPFVMPKDRFEDLTYAMRRAASAADLAVRAGCLHSLNNRLVCRVMLFPGSGSRYRKEGSDAYTIFLNNTYFVLAEDMDPVFVDGKKFAFKKDAEAKKKGRFKLEVATIFDGIVSSDQLPALYKQIADSYKQPSDKMIPQKSLQKFLECYMRELIRIDAIPQALNDALLGWRKNAPHGLDTAYPSYYRDESVVYRKEVDEALDDYLPMAICPGDSIWFAATCFSLCKPLFDFCKIKCSTKFSLQLLINSGTQPTREDSLFLLHVENQAHFWCDFRLWPRQSWAQGKGELKTDYPSKFRNKYTNNIFINRIYHRGFPIILFNYKKLEDEYDTIEYVCPAPNSPMPKSDIERLSSADCLPILVAATPPEKNYANKLCLTLPLRNAKSRIFYKRYDIIKNEMLRDQHTKINGYYIHCMELLSDRIPSKIAPLLKKSYQKALSTLSTSAKTNKFYAEQLSCLLGSLYFLRDALKCDGQKVERLNHLIQAFQREIGIVSVVDFSEFINETIQDSNLNQEVLFGRDCNGIYLYYGKYWPAFQRYCNQRGLILNETAASFRHSVLIPLNLIRPQFVPANGENPRYDYRKKLDGKSATVLNLSPKILNYSKD